MSDQQKKHHPPAGPIDGVRQDIKQAKDSGVAFDPTGFSYKWNHGFLNKKPWHPMNYKNRVKVWEKEQQHQESERRNAAARQEFKEEQERVKTLSMLSEEEKQKYKERQSVQWLYMKPPGLPITKGDSEDDEERADNAATAAFNSKPTFATDGVVDPSAQIHGKFHHTYEKSSKNQPLPPISHLAKVVSGVKAVMKQQMDFELKKSGNISPPRGGFDPAAENQQFVVGTMDSDQEEKAYREAMMTAGEKKRLKKEAEKERRQRRREAEKKRIDEAKEFLKRAGVELSTSNSSDGGGDDTPGVEGKDGDGDRGNDLKRKRR